MRKRLAIFLAALAVVVALLLAAAAGMFVAWKVRQPKFASTPNVVVQIQSLSDLVTVKYVIEKVISYDDPKYFADVIPLGDNKLVLLAHGVVKAGVDLSKVTESDVRVAEGSIRIVLPPATLTDAYLDEKRTQVLDRRTGLLRKFDKDLERTARQHALSEIQRAARQNGIEREADERAREQLTGLLRALGYKHVEIRSRSR
jgi:hypothetical protein